MNKMFNFNGMPRKRSGHAGGKSVSTIGMLVFLMAALLVLPSCFDDDDDETVTVKEYVCPDGTTADSKDDCPAVEPPPQMTQCQDGTTVTAPATCPAAPQYDHVIMEDDPANFTGGDAPDSIAGDMRDNEISGMGGNDEISGMGGNDILIGGDGEDTLRGGEGDDMLTGGAGNDMLDGGEGGEEKGDTAVYSNAMRVRVDLETGKANVIRQASTDPFAGAAEEDTLTNIENVTGSPGEDEITGDSEDNTLDGKGGNDTIMGGGGDDILIDEDYDADANDNAGNAESSMDKFDGGGGDDTLKIEDSRSLTINLTDITNDLVTITNTDNDTVAIATITTQMMEDGEGESVAVSTIENIDCNTDDGAGKCTITGDAMPNKFTVGDNDSGHDLNGGGGDDTLNGGGGPDTLNGDAGNDTINAGGGDDTAVDGGPGNDIINGGAGGDTLNGGEGDDELYGNDDGETVAIDTLAGGPGNDKYFPSISISDNTTTTDTVTETEANDPVATPPVVTEDKVIYFMYYVEPMEGEDPPAPTLALPSNVEVLHGTRYNDTITSAGGGTLLGHEGNDTFTGGTSDETFVGCAGDDKYTGGGGDDVFGIVNTGGDSGVDIIMDFTGDEIHIKGYDSDVGATTVVTPGTNQVEIHVGGVRLAVVQTTDTSTYTDGAALKKALDADGVIVFDTMFDPASNKCVSPDPMM